MQTVHKFAIILQTLKDCLQNIYNNYHCKTHLYSKMLFKIHHEFDKYVTKLKDLNYNNLLIKLNTTEKNLLSRVKTLKDCKSKSFKVRNDDTDKNLYQKCKQENTNFVKWCWLHKINHHDISKCWIKNKRKASQQNKNIQLSKNSSDVS